MAQCRSRKQNGERCGADAQSGKDLCVFHDPDKAAVVRRARRDGGISRTRVAAVLPPDTPDSPLEDVHDISQLLAQSINQLRRGQLDPKVANALGYLLTVLLRSLEQSRTQQSSSILEETADSNPKLSTDLVDRLVARKLTTHQTQLSCGDKDFYYGAEVIYKRLGLIQPNSVKAVANGGTAASGAVAIGGSTFRERFKSMWLLSKEMEMISDFEAEADTARRNSIPGAGQDRNSQESCISEAPNNDSHSNSRSS